MSLRDSLESALISGDASDASSAPSISWRQLGLGAIASFISAAALGISDVVLSTGRWVSSSMLSVASWLEGLGESAGTIASEATSTSVASWASFVSDLGPAALPVSVAVGVGMILTMIWVFRNVS